MAAPDPAKHFRYLRKTTRLLHNRLVENFLKGNQGAKRYRFLTLALKINEKDSAPVAALRMLTFYLILVAKGRLNDPVLVPDRWQYQFKTVRQLKLLYRSPRSQEYSITIPHWSTSRRQTEQLTFPDLSKGDYTLQVRFGDNSKITINAYSFKEAERLWKWIQPHIESKMRPTAELSYYRGSGRRKIRLQPYKGVLYNAQGQKEWEFWCKK